MKFSCKSHIASMILSGFTTIILNLALWRFIWQHLTIQSPLDVLFLISLPIFLFGTLTLFYGLLMWPYINKLLIPLLLIIAAVINYVTFNLGIFIDSEMIRNVLETNSREAGDLVTVSGILWILFLGILPAFVFIKLKIKWQTPWKEIRSHALLIILSITLSLGLAGVLYKEYAAFGRNNKQVMRLVNPINVLNATKGYVKKQILANKQFVTLDAEAAQKKVTEESPTVLVLIVGETARAANFSLNGYPRETNPELKKEDIINFPDVSSCGTATAISVPCMFSYMTRTGFDVDNAAYSENILDLIKQSGINILWKDNDDGCKGVCKRIPTEEMVKQNNPKYCKGKSCFDEVLIDDLDEYLSKVTKDSVLVLHAMGSHGPTYYKRYPPEFRKFTPTCDTAEIQSCSREAITNTYDNTILYTDYVIAKTINTLKKYDQLGSSLLYLSDHGESLGEKGTYLHSLPYAIAPDEQTKIPMILWLSKTMQRDEQIDYACMKNRAKTLKFSQDNLFHTLLGMTEVKSKLYDKNLDILDSCRNKILFN